MTETAEMNLVRLIERFGSEDRCRAYLEALRWPEGPVCPRCEGTSISKIEDRRQYECNDRSCRYQFSVTAGTLFHDSHLPLWKWFLAIYLMGESKKGISAKQLQRMLKVSYKTAWYLAHRIRDAMGDDEQPLLRGIVEVDETLIGGHRKGYGVNYRGNKPSSPALSSAEARSGCASCRTSGAASCTASSAQPLLMRPTIYTDELRSYEGIADHDTRHETVTHKAEEWVRGNVHTNTVESAWSLLKRSVVGTYHQISVKHLDAYLDEMEFRFNRRDNPYLFRDTILVLLHGDALPYAKLIEKPDLDAERRARDLEIRRTKKMLERRGLEPC